MTLFKAELDLSELTEFVKELDNAEEKVQDVLTATARDLATEALSLIIDNTSVVTGELKASWKIGDVVVRGDTVEIDVYSDLYYAAWYEYGHAQTPGRYVAAIEGRKIEEPKREPVKVEEPHWAEKHYKNLNDKGIKVHEKRFDDKITRGEVMALIDRATDLK